MKNLRFVIVAVGSVLLGGAPAIADTCPPSPPKGATLKKLEVGGTCITDSGTVNGGAIVKNGGHWEVVNETVHGGIIVQPGGELDIQNDPNSGPVPGQSLVDGGILANSPFDLDILNVKINGGMQVENGTPGFYYLICAIDASGGLSFKNKVSGLHVGIGYNPFGIRCDGNNSVSGSVTIDNTIVDLKNTLIHGSLLCINGGKVNDKGGNRVTGNNNCF